MSDVLVSLGQGFVGQCSRLPVGILFVRFVLPPLTSFGDWGKRFVPTFATAPSKL